MKDKDKYQGQSDYILGWNLDALRIERYSNDNENIFLFLFNNDILLIT